MTFAAVLIILVHQVGCRMSEVGGGKSAEFRNGISLGSFLQLMEMGKRPAQKNQPGYTKAYPG